MTKPISLDTGPISLYFTKNHSKDIDLLFESIKTNHIKAFVIAPVLSEVYKHLCVANGKDFANSTLIALLKSLPIQVVSLNQSLILKAGELKCRFRKELSYIDAMGIALSLDQKISFHTTEKKLKSLPNNILTKLKTVTYSFSNKGNLS